jgi:hypothetical protein
MRMAIAERPDLTGQPLALVHADLSELAGWHAQLDAAERLTRSGAIEPQQWFAIYTSRVPSASGGVWDRVAAVQASMRPFWRAMPPRCGRRLPEAFAHMQAGGPERRLRHHLRRPVAARAADGGCGASGAAHRASVAGSTSSIAQSAVAQDEGERIAFAVARGQPIDPGGRDAIRPGRGRRLRRDA